jgi:hypothetical protein
VGTLGTQKRGPRDRPEPATSLRTERATRVTECVRCPYSSTPRSGLAAPRPRFPPRTTPTARRADHERTIARVQASQVNEAPRHRLQVNSILRRAEGYASPFFSPSCSGARPSCGPPTLSLRTTRPLAPQQRCRAAPTIATPTSAGARPGVATIAQAAQAAGSGLAAATDVRAPSLCPSWSLPPSRACVLCV